jgi:hypothetical protein
VSGRGVYAYANNNPYRYTDPSGEETEQIEETVVTGTRPPPPPPPPPPSATLAEIVVTARAVSKAERAEPFLLNPIGLAILGPFIPGRMGDATCDNGNCNKMQAKQDKSKKKSKAGVGGQEGAKDVPSWAKGERPNTGESGKDFADRLLGEKYGEGNYPTGPGSEHSKIQKWGDRSFTD